MSFDKTQIDYLIEQMCEKVVPLIVDKLNKQLDTTALTNAVLLLAKGDINNINNINKKQNNDSATFTENSKSDSDNDEFFTSFGK